ncbi:MAG: hypothetical protein J6J62_02225 [Oscillospiraceae bacterium]|nr:hypothetical protein [Oscillospiraceae bacterium]
MRIMRHYAVKYSPELDDLLNKCGIAHDLSSGLIVFDMSDSDEHFDAILRCFPSIHPWHTWYEFSEDEMNESEWFTMCSTNTKLENVLEEKTFEYSHKYTAQVISGYYTGTPKPEYREFYSHETQIAPYYFSKKIKWGRNFFYSVLKYGVQDLFCNDVAKNIITNNGLKGASFLPPLKKQTNEPMEDAYQFIIDNVLPEEACDVVDYDDICYCPVCGKRKYLTNTLSRLRVSKSALGNQDFYATEPIFSMGGKAGLPDRFSIISRKAYEVFKASGFTRTLEIAPLLTY